MVQLNVTPEIEVFDMLFERSLSIFSMTSLTQLMEYSHFRCEIQLDLPVDIDVIVVVVTGAALDRDVLVVPAAVRGVMIPAMDSVSESDFQFFCISDPGSDPLKR